jgi:hypothetical protein
MSSPLTAQAEKPAVPLSDRVWHCLLVTLYFVLGMVAGYGIFNPQQEKRMSTYEVQVERTTYRLCVKCDGERLTFTPTERTKILGHFGDHGHWVVKHIIVGINWTTFVITHCSQSYAAREKIQSELLDLLQDIQEEQEKP